MFNYSLADSKSKISNIKTNPPQVYMCSPLAKVIQCLRFKNKIKLKKDNNKSKISD